MPRLVRFQYSGSPGTLPTADSAPRWGLLADGSIADLSSLEAFAGTDFLDLLRNWSEWRGRLTGHVESSPIYQSTSPEIKLLPPVPEGGKIVCIGLNYRDHAIESGMEIPSEPVVFNKLSGTLCGHESSVPLPACSDQVDYEAELVIVLGRRTWQVSEDEAEAAIVGYTCGHDVSARDWQLGRPGGQWLLGKSFPNFAPLGPAIVTRDEIADPLDLRIALRINGETMQESSTQQLIFTPAQLIAHLSQCCVLEAGDVIFTGTPPGVGMARQPQRWIEPGDVCEVEIEGVGTLRNRFERLPVE